MKFSLKSTYTAILGFLGITAEEGKESVELTDEQVDKIEAALPELATAKARVTELEAAAATHATTVEGLNAQITALTTERDALKTENATQKTEITRLGQLDAGNITVVAGEADKHTDDAIDAATMGFQKELMGKVD